MSKEIEEQSESAFWMSALSSLVEAHQTDNKEQESDR